MRPAIDLLAQVPDLPPGEVVDLGCGDGAVGPALALRFADRLRVGIDSSAAMLASAAGQEGIYSRLEEADIARWQPVTPPALIFSNAALQWLPENRPLVGRLARMLRPGGVLAVQMPGQSDAPSHHLARQTALRIWGGLPVLRDPVDPPEVWHRLLAPLGAVSAWETSYMQPVPARAAGHPVRAFTESTYLLPILEGRSAAEKSAFLAAYDAALAEAYPLQADGSALFAFRRVFFVLIRAEDAISAAL